jgi:hypothetical protein
MWKSCFLNKTKITLFEIFFKKIIEINTDTDTLIMLSVDFPDFLNLIMLIFKIIQKIKRDLEQTPNKKIIKLTC